MSFGNQVAVVNDYSNYKVNLLNKLINANVKKTKKDLIPIISKKETETLRLKTQLEKLELKMREDMKKHQLLTEQLQGIQTELANLHIEFNAAEN